MKISECIGKLLQHYELVVIPGFGILHTEEVSATIHPVEHSFRPPHKKFSFEPATAKDDRMLTNSFAELNRITHEQAIEELKKLLDEIKNSLHDKGAYELEGIGKFYYDIERHLQFASHPEKNFLLSSHGLPEFAMKPILRPENIPTYSTAKSTPEKKKRKFIWFRF